MDRIGRVLIVTNQVYHKPHAGSYTLDCKECKITTRPQDIAKEDMELNNLVKIFKELGFTDKDGGTNNFVYKDQTKAQMIALLETGKRKKVHITVIQLQYPYIFLQLFCHFQAISKTFLCSF